MLEDTDMTKSADRAKLQNMLSKRRMSVGASHDAEEMLETEILQVHRLNFCAGLTQNASPLF
jgi:hypothetical protein